MRRRQPAESTDARSDPPISSAAHGSVLRAGVSRPADTIRMRLVFEIAEGKHRRDSLGESVWPLTAPELYMPHLRVQGLVFRAAACSRSDEKEGPGSGWTGPESGR